MQIGQTEFVKRAVDFILKSAMSFCNDDNLNSSCMCISDTLNIWVFSSFDSFLRLPVI